MIAIDSRLNQTDSNAETNCAFANERSDKCARKRGRRLRARRLRLGRRHKISPCRDIVDQANVDDLVVAEALRQIRQIVDCARKAASNSSRIRPGSGSSCLLVSGLPLIRAAPLKCVEIWLSCCQRVYPPLSIPQKAMSHWARSVNGGKPGHLLHA